MRPSKIWAPLAVMGVLWASALAFAQGNAAIGPPADPWPRGVDFGDAQVLVYQPQINSWTDNQLDFRAALAIKPTGAKAETFGVIFATTRTQVDKVLRTVTFENLKISKIDFPTLPNRGAAYAAELQTQFARLDPHHIARPPRFTRSRSPASSRRRSPCRTTRRGSSSAIRRRSWCRSTVRRCCKAVPNSQFQRVINTRALILQGTWAELLHPRL